MENKQMDKRHQRTDDKSTQKTNNGFKNNPNADQQKPNSDMLKSKQESSFDPKDKSVSRPDSKMGSDWNSSQSEDQKPNQQTGKKQTSTDQNSGQGKDTSRSDNRNQGKPSREVPFDKNHDRETDAGVIDEDRGPFQDEEMEHPSQKKSYGESIDTENSNIDFPKKRNQAPPSEFS